LNELSASNVDEANIGEIHSLYQDLFLTDIKKEVESAQSELKQCKQEQNNAQREMTLLKKENQNLQATLKRYRKQLQEITAGKDSSTANNLLNSLVNPTQNQKVMMSLDTTSNIEGASNTNRTTRQLKRSVSILWSHKFVGIWDILSDKCSHLGSSTTAPTWKPSHFHRSSQDRKAFTFLLSFAECPR
jgi:hypothetical protein